MATNLVQGGIQKELGFATLRRSVVRWRGFCEASLTGIDLYPETSSTQGKHYEKHSSLEEVRSVARLSVYYAFGGSLLSCRSRGSVVRRPRRPSRRPTIHPELHSDNY